MIDGGSAMADSPAALVQRFFDAFRAGDRTTAEAMLADDLLFRSPHDPALDKAGYFERCWPNREHLRSQRLDRVFEQGDEVFISYEAEREGAPRFRNAELIRVVDGRIREIDVFYGADR
jgi:ketosteroid isomerase-like protein